MHTGVRCSRAKAGPLDGSFCTYLRFLLTRTRPMLEERRPTEARGLVGRWGKEVEGEPLETLGPPTGRGEAGASFWHPT